MRSIRSKAPAALIALALLAGACGDEATTAEVATTPSEAPSETTAVSTAPTTATDETHEHGGYDPDSWPLSPSGVSRLQIGSDRCWVR
jgi:hypothetical protein